MEAIATTTKSGHLSCCGRLIFKICTAVSVLRGKGFFVDYTVLHSVFSYIVIEKLAENAKNYMHYRFLIINMFCPYTKNALLKVYIKAHC